MTPRFLTLADVVEQLNISMAQARALVRSGELPAIQLGGRGVWRVETRELEAYIERKYAENRERIANEHGEHKEPGRDAEHAEHGENRELGDS
ncbi:MAG: helix-turn-helix domain-containing protein [Actinomycetota bacterium]|nr:helix-turn-helix domain-containing protein [Actinomycetota bacterium]